MTYTTTTTEQCKCCDGKGWQMRNDGIKIKCPACGGTGYWTKELETVPYVPRVPYPPAPWMPDWYSTGDPMPPPACFIC